MKKCIKCKELNNDEVQKCQKCGCTLFDGHYAQSQSLDKIKQPSLLNDMNTPNSSSYEATRMTSQFISGIGWIIAGISLITFLTFLVTSFNTHYGFSFMALLPALLGIAVGIIIAVIGQLARSNVDTADYSATIVQLLEEQKKDIVSVLHSNNSNLEKLLISQQKSLRELQNNTKVLQKLIEINENKPKSDTAKFEKCSKCNSKLKKTKTKSGKAVLTCINYPKCKTIIPID